MNDLPSSHGTTMRTAPVEDTFSLCSLESTNETVTDLPGPGRLIDKYVYQRAGRALESAIASLRRKLQTAQALPEVALELNDFRPHLEEAQNDGPSNENNHDHNHPASLYYECSLFSSSTLTASDNIGPGRTLYKLYKLGGKAIESVAGDLAHGAGYGPHATGKRIVDTYEALRYGWWKSFVDNEVVSDRMLQLEGTLFEQCKALAEYSLCVI